MNSYTETLSDVASYLADRIHTDSPGANVSQRSKAEHFARLRAGTAEQVAYRLFGKAVEIVETLDQRLHDGHLLEFITIRRELKERLDAARDRLDGLEEAVANCVRQIGLVVKELDLADKTGAKRIEYLKSSSLLKVAKQGLTLTAPNRRELASEYHWTAEAIVQHEDGKKDPPLQRKPDIDDALVKRWASFRNDYPELPTPKQLGFPDMRRGSYAHFCIFATDKFDDMPSDDAKKIGDRIRARRKRNQDDENRSKN